MFGSDVVSIWAEDVCSLRFEDVDEGASLTSVCVVRLELVGVISL